MISELNYWLTSRRRNTPRSRRTHLGVTRLEERRLPTVSAGLVGHDLIVRSTGADLVYILESAPGTFRVGASAASAAASPTSYSGLRNLQVNLTGSGALVYVAGLMNPPDAPDAQGISGNFTVTAQPGTTLAVEVHDGFAVNGAVQVVASGATFLSHFIGELPGDATPADQRVDGVFLDPNRRGSYGSVQISGNGPVGLDGVRALGNVTINLGLSPSSAFVIDREWVDREDPGSPPWTRFQQDPTSIGGNLIVTGGVDAEVYNTNVSGRVYLTQASTDPNAKFNVVFGGDSIGGDLTIQSPGGRTDAAFIDFTTVGGSTSISQLGTSNVLALQTSYFGRSTSFTQGASTRSQGKGGAPVPLRSSTDRLFIDSGAALQALAASTPGGLPTDAAYLKRLTDAGVLPTSSGSRFLQTVTSNQFGSSNTLVIGQDTTALTSFITPSLFTAAPGSSNTLHVKTTSVPPTFVGYV